MEETISEVSILEWFVSSKVLLWPLETQNPKTHVKRDGGEIDALIDVSLPPDQGSYAFVVEVKSRSTPEAILQAAHKAKMFARNQEWPMIVVPYLSPSRIMSLKDLGVSGIDRCGNGIVIVPGRICVVHVGNSNRFPDSRPLHNPYRG